MRSLPEGPTIFPPADPVLPFMSDDLSSPTYSTLSLRPSSCVNSSIYFSSTLFHLGSIDTLPWATNNSSLWLHQESHTDLREWYDHCLDFTALKQRLVTDPPDPHDDHPSMEESPLASMSTIPVSTSGFRDCVGRRASSEPNLYQERLLIGTGWDFRLALGRSCWSWRRLRWYVPCLSGPCYKGLPLPPQSGTPCVSAYSFATLVVFVTARRVVSIASAGGHCCVVQALDLNQT